MSTHITPEALVASNRNVSNFLDHFLAEYFIPFHRATRFISPWGGSIQYVRSKIGGFDPPSPIHSILEDSPILLFFFRFSLLMLCICCKVRDLHMSRCVRITKHKQQQRSCILVQTRTQHKKRVPTVAEKCRRCYSLFSQV